MNKINNNSIPENFPKPENDGLCDHLEGMSIPDISLLTQNGDNLKFSGFGSFSVRSKSERPGRNPKTGEEIPVSARRVVTYKASQKIKDRVADRVEILENTSAEQTTT